MTCPSACLAALGIGLPLLLVGCAQPRAGFQCTTREQCVSSGEQGVCEPTGYCSFVDPACPGSGQRYGRWAADGLAGTCVGQADAGQDDAGPDAPLDVGPVDAGGPETCDAGCGRCWVRGHSCDAGCECLGGSCVQGVCCNSTCSGGCGTCTRAGSEGTCSPLPDGTQCRAAVNACDVAEHCDGGTLDCPPDGYAATCTFTYINCAGLDGSVSVGPNGTATFPNGCLNDDEGKCQRNNVEVRARYVPSRDGGSWSFGPYVSQGCSTSPSAGGHSVRCCF